MYDLHIKVLEVDQPEFKVTVQKPAHVKQVLDLFIGQVAGEVHNGHAFTALELDLLAAAGLPYEYVTRVNGAVRTVQMRVVTPETQVGEYWNRYTKTAIQFDRMPADKLGHTHLAGVGELGEFANVLKKIESGVLSYEEGKPKLLEELGDFCWYAALHWNYQGISTTAIKWPIDPPLSAPPNGRLAHIRYWCYRLFYTWISDGWGGGNNKPENTIYKVMTLLYGIDEAVTLEKLLAANIEKLADRAAKTGGSIIDHD